MYQKYSFSLLLLISIISLPLHAGFAEKIASHIADDTEHHALNALVASKGGYVLPALAGLQGVDAGMRLHTEMKAIRALLPRSKKNLQEHNAAQKSTAQQVRSWGTEVIEALPPVASLTFAEKDERSLYESSPDSQGYKPLKKFGMCDFGFGAMYVALAGQALDMLHRLISGRVVFSDNDQEAIQQYIARLRPRARKKAAKLQHHLRAVARANAVLRSLQALGTAASFGMGRAEGLDRSPDRSKRKDPEGWYFLTLAGAGLFGLLQKTTSIYTRWRINSALRALRKKALEYRKKKTSHSS